MNIKNQLQELLATDPMTYDTICEIKALLADPPTAKQSNTDQRTINSLKAAIQDLKNQIKAPSSPLTNEDDLLDRMFTVQARRTAEIESKGHSVTLNLSERTFKALQASPDTLYFAPQTPIAIGTQVKSDSHGLSIITEFKQAAGRIEAKIFNPHSTFQIWTKTPTASGGENLKAEGTSSPCNISGDTLTTFRVKFPSGTLLKVSDSFFEVLGSYQDGNLVTHKIKAYADPSAANLTIPRFAKQEISDMPRNYSMYNNQVM